jgi:hypothetical protein
MYCITYTPWTADSGNILNGHVLAYLTRIHETKNTKKHNLKIEWQNGNETLF